MRTESPTGLYWSVRGSVLCVDHAREVDDARWTVEAWEPLPRSSQGFAGSRYQCQRCSPDGTALAHSGRTRQPPAFGAN